MADLVIPVVSPERSTLHPYIDVSELTMAYTRLKVCLWAYIAIPRHSKAGGCGHGETKSQTPPPPGFAVRDVSRQKMRERSAESLVL
jgi:hypothetical protein